MRHSFYITILFFLLSCTSNNSQNKKANYYKKATIWYDSKIHLIYPLADSVGLKTSCYYVTYEKDKISSITYFEYGKPANESTIKNEGSSFFNECSQMKIAYDNNYEIRTYFDKDFNPSMQWGVHKERLKKENKLYTTIFYYDFQDKLTNGFRGFSQLVYIYNDNGYVVSFRDKNGNKTKSAFNLIGQVFFEQKNKIIISNINTDISIISNNVYSFDKNYNIIEMYSLNEDGSIIRDHIIPIEIHKYDSFGNLIEKKFVDVDGNYVKTSDQFFGVKTPLFKFEYDSYTNLIKESFYGRDEQLARNRVAYITYSRDSTGKVIKKRYWNYNHELYHDGIAIREFIYDMNGNFVKEIKYDRNKKIIS